MCIPVFLTCPCISWSKIPQKKDRRISWHVAELLSEEQTPFSLGNTLAHSPIPHSRRPSVQTGLPACARLSLSGETVLGVHKAMEQCLNQGCQHSWLAESHSQLTPSLSLLTRSQAPAQRVQHLRDRGVWGRWGRGARGSSRQQAHRAGQKGALKIVLHPVPIQTEWVWIPMKVWSS